MAYPEVWAAFDEGVLPPRDHGVSEVLAQASERPDEQQSRAQPQAGAYATSFAALSTLLETAHCCTCRSCGSRLVQPLLLAAVSVDRVPQFPQINVAGL